MMNNVFLKKRKLQFSWMLFIPLLASSLLMMNSCEKDKDEPKKPVVTAINPATAPVNTNVEITGENFASGAVVKFGTQTAENLTVTDTKISTKVPEGLAVGATSVTVTVGSETSEPFSFEVVAEPIPLIDSITPASAKRDSVVTIYGSNFATGAIVKFGNENTLVTLTTVTDTVITTAVPANATVGATTVTVTVDGKTSNAFDFEVLDDAPVITGFAPIKGHVGTSVTITGENFSDTDNENEVKFGDITATVTSATTTQIEVAVPEGVAEGEVSISITVGDKTHTAEDEFKITPPIKSLFWVQMNEGTGAYELVRGYENDNGELQVTVLYDVESEGDFSGTICQGNNADEIYWAENVTDLGTWQTVTKIFKGDDAGSSPVLVSTVEIVGTDFAIDENAGELLVAGLSGDYVTRFILKVDLDQNTDQDTVYITGNTISTVVLDPLSDDFYFIEEMDDGVRPFYSTVYKGNADGSSITKILSEEDLPLGAQTFAIFIDMVTDGTTLFIAQQHDITGTSKILSGSVNGGTFTDLYVSNPGSSSDPLPAITLDKENSCLYWNNKGDQKDRFEGDEYSGEAYLNVSVNRGKTTGGEVEFLFDGIMCKNTDYFPIQ